MCLRQGKAILSSLYVTIYVIFQVHTYFIGVIRLFHIKKSQETGFTHISFQYYSPPRRNPNLLGARTWRGGRVAECTGLENRRRFIPTQGSNPCLSAIHKKGPPGNRGAFFMYGGEAVFGLNQFRKKCRKAFFDAKDSIAPRRGDAHGCALSIPLPVHNKSIYSFESPLETGGPFLCMAERQYLV